MNVVISRSTYIASGLHYYLHLWSYIPDVLVSGVVISRLDCAKRSHRQTVCVQDTFMAKRQAEEAKRRAFKHQPRFGTHLTPVKQLSGKSHDRH